MTSPRRRAYLGMGSNIDSLRNIASGRAALVRQFGPAEFSTLYESPPLNGVGDSYLNLVCALTTTLNWSELGAQLKRIEDKCGRVRGENAGTAVALDLDLLNLIGADPDDQNHALEIDELRHASFVLAPLAELLPDWRHPQTHLTLAELWGEVADSALPLKVVSMTPAAADAVVAQAS